MHEINHVCVCVCVFVAHERAAQYHFVRFAADNVSEPIFEPCDKRLVVVVVVVVVLTPLGRRVAAMR